MLVVQEEIEMGPVRASLARPEDPAGAPFPGVVVVHEMFGLNDDMRRIARRFAENGYVAVAPDLFSAGNRLVCLTRVLADLVRGARGETLSLLSDVRNGLAAMDEVDSERIGVVGFCMGGSFALLLGTTGLVSAAAVNYGAVPKERSELDGVCPVVGSYGAKDRLFAGQGHRLEQHLSALGVAHDVKVYEGVGHSFLNDVSSLLVKLPSPMAVGYSEPEAEDAWSRILAFFATHV